MNKKVMLIATLILAIASLAAVVTLWETEVILFLLLLIIASGLLLLQKSIVEFKVFLSCGVAGGAAEAVAVIFNVWTYTNTSLMNIPFWLPVLWGIAAVFILRVQVFFKS